MSEQIPSHVKNTLGLLSSIPNETDPVSFMFVTSLCTLLTIIQQPATLLACNIINNMGACGQVDRALDSRSEGLGFNLKY